MQKLVASGAFYIFALAAQLSDYHSTVAAMALAVIATLLLAFRLWNWINARREKHDKPRFTLEPSHLIVFGLIGTLVWAATALGGVIWQQRLSSLSQGGDERNAVSKVEFARNGIIATNDIYGPYGPQPVTYVADPIINCDRLRVFVDYSMLVPPNNIGNGWTSRNRVQIAEFKDYVRGQKLIISVLSGYEQDGYKNLMRWGAITAALPDGDHIFGLANTYRARLVLMGSDGREQYHYFLIVCAVRPDRIISSFCYCR